MKAPCPKCKRMIETLPCPHCGYDYPEEEEPATDDSDRKPGKIIETSRWPVV